MPFLGAAIGAAAGALGGALTDVGIDNAFINNVLSEVTPGTSALFLLSEDAVVDRVAKGFRLLSPHELIASNLSTEQEAKLRDAFAQVHSIDRRSTASAELCRISPEVKEWKLYLP